MALHRPSCFSRFDELPFAPRGEKGEESEASQGEGGRLGDNQWGECCEFTGERYGASGEGSFVTLARVKSSEPFLLCCVAAGSRKERGTESAFAIAEKGFGKFDTGEVIRERLGNEANQVAAAARARGFTDTDQERESRSKGGSYGY